MANKNLFTGPTHRMPARGSGWKADLSRVYRNAQTLEEVDYYLSQLAGRGNQAGWLARNTPGAFLPGVRGNKGEFVLDSTIEAIRSDLNRKRQALLQERQNRIDAERARQASPVPAPSSQQSPPQPTQVSPSPQPTSNRPKANTTPAATSRPRSSSPSPTPQVSAPTIQAPATPSQLRPMSVIPMAGIPGDVRIPNIGDRLATSPIRLPGGATLGTSSILPGYDSFATHPAFSSSSDAYPSSSMDSREQLEMGTGAEESSGKKNPSGRGLGSVLSGVGNYIMDNAGNLLSMYGTYAGMRDQMNLIRENRATDTPNTNPYVHFGQRGMDEMDMALESIGFGRARSLDGIHRGYNQQVQNIGANSRSVNGARVMSQALADQYYDSIGQAEANYAQMLAQQHQARASQLNNMDQMVMQGEAARDLADRQDKDNYYNNLGTAIQTRASGLQTLGRDMNMYRRNVVSDRLINALSQYGFALDGNGNLYKVGG